MTSPPPFEAVITAAGDSRRRFLDAGFGVPKSLVVVAGKSVLQRAFESYAALATQAAVAINKEEDEEWQVGKMLRASFPEATVTSVPSAVKGALVSALFALETPDPGLPLLVTSGDSEVAGGIAHYVALFLQSGAACGTLVFRSSNPRWSYVSVDEEGGVLQVAEKEVIGQFASTGAYFFSSRDLFLEAAEWVLMNEATLNGQFYTSTTLNYALAQGLDVSVHEISRTEYKSWSLPHDFVCQTP